MDHADPTPRATLRECWGCGRRVREDVRDCPACGSRLRTVSNPRGQ